MSKPNTFALVGGIDEVSQPLAIKPESDLAGQGLLLEAAGVEVVGLVPVVAVAVDEPGRHQHAGGLQRPGEPAHRGRISRLGTTGVPEQVSVAGGILS